MPEWSPSIDSGLSGDAYLSEQIEAFAKGPSDARRPAVYALKVSVPNDWRTVEERWGAAYDVDVPAWVEHAFHSKAVLYVGAAKDVYGRIVDHLESANPDKPSKSSALMAVYPIHSVWDVWFFEDVERAFERESGIALGIQASLSNVYVHQR